MPVGKTENVVQQAMSDFGRFCFDGRERVDGNLHDELDRRKRDLSKLSVAPTFFHFLHCCCLFESCGGAGKKSRGQTVGQGQGVWREWHFGISIVHYVQARGP